MVDNQAARAWYDAVGASDKDWHEQPKSGHVIPLDCEWQETVDLIHDFALPPQRAAMIMFADSLTARIVAHSHPKTTA